jgi:hypothetical protein
MKPLIERRHDGSCRVGSAYFEYSSTTSFSLIGAVKIGPGRQR